MCFRKLLLMVWVILLLAYSLWPIETRASSWDKEFDLALTRMYENGMTKYDNVTTYWMQYWVIREQWAKFFSMFMGDILEKNQESVTWQWCDFTDSETFDPTLAEAIDTSCEQWLFKWTQWAFLPQQPLTKAQALTVLVRALEWPQDESVTPRWKNYFDRARWLGLTKEVDVLNLDKPVTRYEIALLLYRAVHDSVDPDLVDLQELEELLLELWLLTS